MEQRTIQSRRLRRRGQQDRPPTEEGSEMKPIITPLPDESDKTTNAAPQDHSDMRSPRAGPAVAAPSAVEEVVSLAKSQAKGEGNPWTANEMQTHALALDLAKRLDELSRMWTEAMSAKGKRG